MPRVSRYTKVDPAQKERIARHETSSAIPVRVLAALYSGPQTFTAQDLAMRSDTRQSNIYRWLYALEELGWVTRYSEIRTSGARETVWLRVHHLHPMDPPEVVL